MISIILRVFAFFCFLLAALNQTVLSQPPADLLAWALGAWVLATLLWDFWPWQRSPHP